MDPWTLEVGVGGLMSGEPAVNIQPSGAGPGLGLPQPLTSPGILSVWPSACQEGLPSI